MHDRNVFVINTLLIHILYILIVEIPMLVYKVCDTRYKNVLYFSQKNFGSHVPKTNTIGLSVGYIIQSTVNPLSDILPSHSYHFLNCKGYRIQMVGVRENDDRNN